MTNFRRKTSLLTAIREVREEMAEQERVARQNRPRQATTVPLPVSVDNWLYIDGLMPLTQPEYDQLMHLLTVMRPGLVEAERGEGE